MSTLNMLLAHFGGNPVIPLETAARFFGYKPETLKDKIDKGKIRLPYFRLEDEAQKATILVHIIDFSEWIDKQYNAAHADFQAIWSEQDTDL